MKNFKMVDLIAFAMIIVLGIFISYYLLACGKEITEEPNVTVISGANEELASMIPDTDDVSISENETIEVSASTAPKVNFYKKGYTSQQINIKAKPKDKSKTLKTLSINKKIKYMKHNKKWVRVKYGDVEGYVRKKYISKKKLTNDDILVKLFGYAPSDSEINEMLLVAMSEAGNTEPIEGIERVIEAMINRVHLKKFKPTTLYGILHQGNHFARVKDGSIYRFTINKRTKKAWKNILKRGYVIDNKVCFWGSKGYLSCGEPAYKLGHHYFCY